MNAIGPRLRPYDLDADPRVALRAYIDAMYDCVAHNSCTLHGTSPSTTDLEGLGMIINYAATLRPFGTTTDIINDISLVLLNTYGQFTVFVSYLNSTANIFAPERHPYTYLGVDPDNCPTSATSSFHSDYAFRQCQDQIYHFWNYLTSFSNSPSAFSVGAYADLMHECRNVAGTIEDARLTSAALYIAIDTISTTPADLANTINSILSSPRPPGIAGALAVWYYLFPDCQSLAEIEWRARNSNQFIPPELQCWIGQRSSQCLL